MNIGPLSVCLSVNLYMCLFAQTLRSMPICMGVMVAPGVMVAQW